MCCFIGLIDHFVIQSQWDPGNCKFLNEEMDEWDDLAQKYPTIVNADKLARIVSLIPASTSFCAATKGVRADRWGNNDTTRQALDANWKTLPSLVQGWITEGRAAIARSQFLSSKDAKEQQEKTIEHVMHTRSILGLKYSIFRCFASIAVASAANCP